MSADPMLRCERLEVGYHGDAILPPLDLTIGDNELWVVLGRNGSGKTTLFKTLLGLLPPVSGAVRRLSPTQRFSYVPQRSAFDELFPILAREVVRQGCERGMSFLRPRLKEQKLVNDALEEVGALELAGRPFRALSEGQKQRVLLARLAASEPDLALLDEPTAAMDIVAEKEAFSALDAWRRHRRATVMIVSHYLGVAHEFADQVIFLSFEAQEVVQGSPDEVFAHPSFKQRYGDVTVKGDCDE